MMAPHLTREEIVQRIEGALAAMPIRQREIFLAIRIDELSYEEVSRRTGLDIKTIERAFAAALLAIHRALNDYPGVDQQS